MSKFRVMCQESLDPETYEMSEIVENNLRLARRELKQMGESACATVEAQVSL